MAIESGNLAELLETASHIFDAAPLPIVVFDRDARVRLWNPAAECLFGWTADEVIGQPPPGIPDDEIEQFRQQFQQALSGEMASGVEGRRYTQDGRLLHVWLAASPLRDAAGRVIGVLRIYEDVSARRETEEALQRQAALLDLTFDAILVRDFESDAIRFWNRGAEMLYGFTREEVTGRISHDVLRTVHPVSIAESKEILARTGRWEGELVHTRRDGTQIIVASRWALQREDGEPDAILETNTDISEQKRSEENLAFLAEAGTILASSLDYEKTLTTIAELAVPRIADWCGVHIVDLDGTVRQLAATHVDPAKIELAYDLERRYPFDPETPTGVAAVLRTGQPDLTPEITDEMLVALIDDPELLAIIRELGLRSSMIVPMLLRGQAIGAISLVSAESGRLFSMQDQALAQALANRAALAVDNARLYHEAQRVAAEQSAIVAQMADGVVIADVNGRTVFRNEAAKRIAGGALPNLPLESAMRNLQIVTPDGLPYPPDEFPLARAIATRETVEGGEWRLQTLDGREVVIRGSAAPIVLDDGTLLGGVLTFRDVTLLRNLERQKDEFLSAVAHDLRTPLTAVRGLAQLLRRRVAQGSWQDLARLDEGLRGIEDASTRMTVLIDELLDIARLQMGQALDLNLQSVDLVALVRRLTELQARAGSNAPIVFESSVPELVGQWDADRLDRVVGNLLSNAVKYNPDGGEITVRVGREETEAASYATVSVSDQGIGIPAADLPRIFDRFHRGGNIPASIHGAGIGLTGVRQIVEHHGGTIEVQSQEGEGATFIVRLPLTREIGDGEDSEAN